MRAWYTLAAALGAAACGSNDAGPGTPYLTSEDVLSRPPIAPDAVEPYGTDPVQFGHLRLPPGGGPHPVAVVVHGGCWLAFADLRHLDAFAEWLRGVGWAAWSVEYRRADQAGGGWPGTFTDVGAALDHLRVLAGAYPLDTARVVVLGHSAGGHLALWAAGRPRIATGELAPANPLRVRGVVSLAGIGDLEAFHRERNRGCGADIVPRLLGGTPADVPDRVAQGSPAALLPLGVPQLLVTGEDDGIVPPALQAAYASAARAAGDDVDTRVLGDAAHFEVVAPWGPAWPRVAEVLLPFLQRIAN